MRRVFLMIVMLSCLHGMSHAGDALCAEREMQKVAKQTAEGQTEKGLAAAEELAAKGLTADSVREMSEVVVTGTRQATDVRHLSQTVTTVGRGMLTEKHRSNVLPTLAEQVPGLMVTGRGVMGYGVSNGAAGGMMMRGISSGAGQMMVLIDGHPQYNGVYGHSIADSYQTMMAERVEVLRGPASMLYGSNAMGGVVNIVTRDMKTDGVHTELEASAGSYGTVEVEGTNQVRKGRLTSTVSGQYGRSDNHRANMGFEQYGGQVKLGYDITDHWKAYADVDVTHFNASYPGTESAPMLEADQWITRGAAAIGVENHYEGTSGRISVYDNWGRHKINDGYKATGGTPQTDLFRSKDALAGVSAYQNMTMGWKNPTTLTVGFDYQHIYGEAWYTNRESGEKVVTKKRQMQSCHANENEYAGYAAVSQEIGRIATLNAGVRMDYHTKAGTEWVPQVGLVVRPLTNGEVKATVSKGFRNPTTKEMFLYGTANSDSLHAERLWNYEISWRHHLLGGRLTYGVNLFMIKADNIIQAVNGKNVNTGELENKGIEVDAAWTINDHWALNTNHSWLDMKTPVVGAPTYKGYLGGQWNDTRWRVDVGVMQVCGLYTAVGASETKETFTLLNATVGYRVCRQVELWAKGDNLLGQRYEYVAGMPMPRATFMAGVRVRIN